MSKNSIIVTIIVVVVIIVAAGAWWYASSSSQSTNLAPTQQNTTASNNQNNTQTAGTVSSANPQDTSDVAISGDLSAIDIQMTGLNTDSNNVNQSLNNQ